MLALTRKPEERVIIGDDIVVTVIEIKNGRVRLGFSAPDGVTIDREEVFLRKREESHAAGAVAGKNARLAGSDRDA